MASLCLAGGYRQQIGKLAEQGEQWVPYLRGKNEQGNAILKRYSEKEANLQVIEEI